MFCRLTSVTRLCSISGFSARVSATTTSSNMVGACILYQFFARHLSLTLRAEPRARAFAITITYFYYMRRIFFAVMRFLYLKYARNDTGIVVIISFSFIGLVCTNGWTVGWLGAILSRAVVVFLGIFAWWLIMYMISHRVGVKDWCYKKDTWVDDYFFGKACLKMIWWCLHCVSIFVIRDV